MSDKPNKFRTVFVKPDEESIIIDGLLVKRVGEQIVHRHGNGPYETYVVTAERPSEICTAHHGVDGRTFVMVIYSIEPVVSP